MREIEGGRVRCHGKSDPEDTGIKSISMRNLMWEMGKTPEYRETKKKASSEADVMIISRTRQRRHGGARTAVSKNGRFTGGKRMKTPAEAIME